MNMSQTKQCRAWSENWTDESHRSLSLLGWSPWPPLDSHVCPLQTRNSSTWAKRRAETPRSWYPFHFQRRTRKVLRLHLAKLRTRYDQWWTKKKTKKKSSLEITQIHSMQRFNMVQVFDVHWFSWFFKRNFWPHSDGGCGWGARLKIHWTRRVWARTPGTMRRVFHRCHGGKINGPRNQKYVIKCDNNCQSNGNHTLSMSSLIRNFTWFVLNICRIDFKICCFPFILVISNKLAAKSTALEHTGTSLLGQWSNWGQSFLEPDVCHPNHPMLVAKVSGWITTRHCKIWKNVEFTMLNVGWKA